MRYPTTSARMLVNTLCLFSAAALLLGSLQTTSAHAVADPPRPLARAVAPASAAAASAASAINDNDRRDQIYVAALSRTTTYKAPPRVLDPKAPTKPTTSRSVVTVTPTSTTTRFTTTTRTTTSTRSSTSTTIRTTTTTTTSSKPTSTTTTSSKTTTSTTTRTISTAPSATPTAPGASKPLVAAYYPDWNGGQIPPESVDYSLFDILYFSFALPASDFSLYFTQYNSADLLKRLIARGRAAGTKVCITIGGWTGSAYFSPAVATAANREIFANNIVAMVNAYGADGVDIDWEYPNQPGNPGNILNKADSANLALFLKLLRGKMGSKAIISLATPMNVWMGPDNKPLADVSEHAKWINHVLLMNYDIWGASATPGPNGPLEVCAGTSSWQPEANAKAGVAAWKAAGMPANKIMLGLAAYGYVSDSTATTLIHKREAMMEGMEARKLAARAQMNMQNYRNGKPKILRNSNEADQPAQGVFNVLDIPSSPSPRSFDEEAKTATGPNNRKMTMIKRQTSTGDLSSFYNTQIQFWQLVSYKVLSLGSTGVWYGKNGYTRVWDSCSSTPYLYNQARSTVVTYDDPTSLKIKAQFARAQGLAGTGMWDISGDTTDYALTKGTRQGLGL